MTQSETPNSRFGLIAFAFIFAAVALLGSVVYFTAKRNPPKPQTTAPATTPAVR